jgi:uncharacterized protein (DUF433 family)
MSEIVVRAFSEEHVERLTGVSRRQLRYWDRTGFFEPALGNEDRRVAYSRIYAFRDIAALRVLNVLRNQYSVSLQHLRKVADELAHLSDAKWTAITLFVLNRRVIFVEEGTERYREIVSKQYVMGIPLAAIIADTKRDIERLQVRDDSKIGKIERARNVSHNAPVVAGTRIPVATIKRLAEDGFSVQQIMQEYPTLADADIRAAIAHENDGLAA